jgi:hypothetical protein
LHFQVRAGLGPVSMFSLVRLPTVSCMLYETAAFSKSNT